MAGQTGSPSLLESLVSFAEERGVTLPVLSPLAFELQKLVADPNYSVADVERLILSDQSLAAEVLRAANSPFFGGLAAAMTVRAAIVRLGTEEIVRLVLLATERGKYSVKDPALRTLVADLWRHAGGCAFGAHWLARRLGYVECEEQCFLAGLLHDAGKLLLVRTLDEMRSSGAIAAAAPPAVLAEVLQTAHAEQGRRLLSGWNLPSVYAHIAGDHHAPTFDRGDAVMMMVRLANTACHKLGVGMIHDPSINLAGFDEAIQLGTDDVTLAEMEIAMEDRLVLA